MDGLLETLPDEEDTIVDPLPVPIWLPLKPPPESEELDDLLESLPTTPITAMPHLAMPDTTGALTPIYRPRPSPLRALLATLRRWLSLPG